MMELQGDGRLDAEFWHPQHLQVERAVQAQTWATLGDLSVSVRKGIFDILASEYTESGVPFYRSSDVGDIVPANHDLAYISLQKHQDENQTALRHGDVMLAKTGQARASVVLNEECNVSQDVIAIRLRSGAINPFYLVTYLSTRPGQLQMLRWFQGQVQPHLSLPGAKSIQVSLPPADFQDSIEIEVRQSVELRVRSQTLYAEAEALLLAELGLDRLDLAHQAAYTARFGGAWGAGRLDAEYFQPKYAQTLAVLRQSGKAIGDVARLAKRRFELQPAKSFQYIEIGDLGQAGQVESQTVLSEDAPSRAQWIVRAGDVITSTVRPIRRLSALIAPEQDGLVCSSGFAVLEPTAVEPEVLLVYLRLPIVCEIMDLHTSASMYPAISTTDLLKLPFPTPSAATRERLVELVRQSRTSHQEAHRLLEDAKRRVEEMVFGGPSDNQGRQT